MHKVLPTRWGLTLLETLFVFAFIIAVCWGVQRAWPDNGVVQAVHMFWHVLSLIAHYIGVGFQVIASLLDQL